MINCLLRSVVWSVELFGICLGFHKCEVALLGCVHINTISFGYLVSSFSTLSVEGIGTYRFKSIRKFHG